MSDLRFLLEIPFVTIPPGTAAIGDPGRAGTTFADQYQPFSAVISRPTAMSRCTVTRQDWERVMGDGRFHVDGGLVKPDHPATLVSAIEADAFCQRFSGLAGTPARLPTECEWEYACRVGTDRRFPWGADAQAFPGRVWASEEFTERGITPSVQPVGQLPANEFGLHDLGGLVREWVADGYETTGSGLAIPPGFYPAGGTWKDPLFCGPARVAKGDSVFGRAEAHTACVKLVRAASYSNMAIGFRLVLGALDDGAFTRMRPQGRPAPSASALPPIPVGGSCWCKLSPEPVKGLTLDAELGARLDVWYPRRFIPLVAGEFAQRFAGMLMTPAPRSIVSHRGMAFLAISHPDVDGQGKAIRTRPGVHLVALDTSGQRSHRFVADGEEGEQDADALVFGGWDWNLQSVVEPGRREVALGAEMVAAAQAVASRTDPVRNRDS